MLVVALCAVLSGGAYWNYFLKPRQAELAATELRVDSLIALNERAKAELARGGTEDLQRQATEYREHLRYMRQLVPTGSEVPALLEQVSTAARRVGLDLAAVAPEPVIEGAEFDTYRYNITVTGSYHRLGEFLGNVGSLTRIIAPVNLNLTPSSRTNASVRPGGRPMSADEATLDSKFQIQTYVAKAGASSDASPADGQENNR